MKISGAIFDMDGTLLDSMQIWKTSGSDFLISKGIKPSDDLDLRFCSMSVYEAAGFMKREYGIEGSRDEITDLINKTVEAKYLYEVPLKEGVFDFLSSLNDMGIPMCIATATEKHMADAALKRLGIRHFFKEIFTSREEGVGKDQPNIFYHAARFLGTDVAKTAVFEDSVIAAQTAKKAGFIVCGLYDESFAYKWDRVCEVSDIYAEKMSEFIGKFEMGC